MKAYGDGHIELEVSDNGVGFDPEDIRPDHLGLGIMRERAQAILAQLEIQSEPGGGTEITAVWTRSEERIASQGVQDE
jgi:nitrate/nitrite-specific signal transduction histidine kinase